MAASNFAPSPSASAAARVVLYAPDNRMLPPLQNIEGLESLAWVDSRDVDAHRLITLQQDVQLVLLDYSGGNANYSQSLAQAISQLPIPLPMLGVGSIPEGPQQSALLLAAIRCGVRDFLDLSAPMEDVRDILRRVRRELRPLASDAATLAQASVPEGDLVLLVGVRPGLGTSTLAAHLTVLLAGRNEEKNQVERHLLLLDFGVPAGDGSLYLGVEGGFHLEDALRSVSRIDATFANTAIARHASGLSVLSRSTAALPGEETNTLVQRLRCFYRNILCDLGGTDAASIPTSLLLNAREVWLVTDQSIGALLSLDRCLQHLEQRGVRDDRLRLIVNRHDDGFGLTPEQITARFNVPLLGTLPERSRQLRAAASVGRLLHEQNPSDPYIAALTPLLHRLDPRQEDASASTNAFARLANYMSPSKWKRN